MLLEACEGTGEDEDRLGYCRYREHVFFTLLRDNQSITRKLYKKIVLTKRSSKQKINLVEEVPR